MDLEQLKIEHDMIDQQASGLIDMAAGKPFTHAVASATLASLADLVAAHLEKEDVLVYATVAKVRGRSADEVCAVVTEFNALKADWEAYLAQWTADRVATAWAEFQQDTAEILTRLRPGATGDALAVSARDGEWRAEAAGAVACISERVRVARSVADEPLPQMLVQPR